MKMPPEEEKEQKESRKNDAKQKNPAKKKTDPGMQDKIFFVK